MKNLVQKKIQNLPETRILPSELQMTKLSLKKKLFRPAKQSNQKFNITENDVVSIYEKCTNTNSLTSKIFNSKWFHGSIMRNCIRRCNKLPMVLQKENCKRKLTDNVRANA